jgi:hypothetical protein
MCDMNSGADIALHAQDLEVQSERGNESGGRRVHPVGGFPLGPLSLRRARR